MEQQHSNKVGLGCGTLIVIALIVAAFSGGGEIRKIQRDVSNLRADVQSVEQSVKDLDGRIQELLLALPRQVESKQGEKPGDQQ